MKRSVILTKEGSHTLLCEATGETFHSLNGAIQESQHVFIKNGFLKAVSKFKNINILEMGFGTGLNALLTLDQLQKSSLPVSYTAIDADPIPIELSLQLNYLQFTGVHLQDAFEEMHRSAFNTTSLINGMSFTKLNQDIRLPVNTPVKFNLVYFDAFSADHQPELWTEAVFRSIHEVMADEGILVTYSAKGSVRRTMKAAGFIVERLKGSLGKREMLRATKQPVVNTSDKVLSNTQLQPE